MTSVALFPTLSSNIICFAFPGKIQLAQSQVSQQHKDMYWISGGTYNFFLVGTKKQELHKSQLFDFSNLTNIDSKYKYK